MEENNLAGLGVQHLPPPHILSASWQHYCCDLSNHNKVCESSNHYNNKRKKRGEKSVRGQDLVHWFGSLIWFWLMDLNIHGNFHFLSSQTKQYCSLSSPPLQVFWPHCNRCVQVAQLKGAIQAIKGIFSQRRLKVGLFGKHLFEHHSWSVWSPVCMKLLELKNITL